MADIERRFTALSVELRASKETGNASVFNRIAGYASVFNRESENLGGFIEVVHPNFFNRSRGMGWPGVMARYNHEALLGTTKAGTLRLHVDDEGLWYDVDVPTTRSDILELVERGDVNQSSFAFRVYNDGDEWDLNESGFPRRTLLNGQLVDVAPVDSPAYPQTTAAIRSLASRFEADEAEVRSMAADNELRKLFKVTTGPAPQSLSGAQALADFLRKRDSFTI